MSSSGKLKRRWINNDKKKNEAEKRITSFKFTRRRCEVSKALVHFVMLSSFVTYCWVKFLSSFRRVKLKRKLPLSLPTKTKSVESVCIFCNFVIVFHLLVSTVSEFFSVVLTLAPVICNFLHRNADETEGASLGGQLPSRTQNSSRGSTDQHVHGLSLYPRFFFIHFISTINFADDHGVGLRQHFDAHHWFIDLLLCGYSTNSSL